MSLDAALAALADPTRRSIVEQLRRGPASVGALASPLPMSLTAVLKHIKVLDESGLVARTKHGRVVTCSLRADGFRHVGAFIDDYRGFWEGALDRMIDLLEESVETRDAPI